MPLAAAWHAPAPPPPCPAQLAGADGHPLHWQDSRRSRPWPQWSGIGGGRRFQARPPPGLARRGIAGARPGPPGPAGQRDAPLPRSQPPPVDAAGRRGLEGGGEEEGAWGSGGWPAARAGRRGGGAAAGRRGARRPPHPAGSGPGLTFELSNAQWLLTL